MSCDSCEIKNLLYLYAYHLDSGDLESVAAMFSHARIIGVANDGSEAVREGSEAVLDMYQSFTRLYEDKNGGAATPRTKHMTSNVIVEVDAGGNTASTRAYAVVFQSLEDFPMQPIIGVRYYDKFARVDGKWRFSERKIVSDLFGDLSRHLLQAM